MSTVLVRFSATVNGTKRRCTVRVEKSHANDVEEAELIMANDEPAYREFYRGASPADYEAPLVDPKVRLFR
jgi:hypothetical protein